MWTIAETPVLVDLLREIVICMSCLTKVACNRREKAKERTSAETEQMAGWALCLYSLSSMYQNDGDF